jgi:transposase-like protein
MAPKKLSDSDKQDILSLYRQSEETTVTLASRYGVSTSTVSRILKQNLPEAEYEVLVQKKRSGAFKTSTEQEMLPGVIPEPSPTVEVEAVEPIVDREPDRPKLRSTPMPNRRQRKRLIASPNHADAEAPVEEQPSQLELSADADALAFKPESDALKTVNESDLLDEDFGDLEDEDVDDEDLDAEDLLDDEDLDEDDDDDEDDGDLPVGLGDVATVHIQGSGLVRVLPLSDAAIPKTCYVVVDRSSELITRPLKDFADLGQIPTEETQEKTLPIFDNHRVAKRFLRRMQRIVKVPDSRVFQKVRPYLQAKGITRLLIDGQVYSL